MTTVHTSGTWFVTPIVDYAEPGDSRDPIYSLSIGSNHQEIASLLDRGEQDQANANLIAAAPDLLEALTEALMSGGTTDREWMPRATLWKMQAAIAKAEGREREKE